MKKRVLLSLFLLLALVLTGCSGGTSQAPGATNSTPPVAEETTDYTAKDIATDETDDDSVPGINVSLGDLGEHLTLPDSFPEEVFPLPEDANIVNVNESSASKGVGIIFKTNKSFEEAVAYCQELMENGTVTIEDRQDGSYLMIGSKEQYNVMITVSKYDDENVSILFDVQPQ